MGKLVRDRIPEIIRHSGARPEIRTLTEQEYRGALIEKLFEEAAELREAKAADQLEEAADVYEVLLALLASAGFTPENLRITAERKRVERGGFAERIWLE